MSDGVGVVKGDLGGEDKEGKVGTPPRMAEVEKGMGHRLD